MGEEEFPEDFAFCDAIDQELTAILHMSMLEPDPVLPRDEDWKDSFPEATPITLPPSDPAQCALQRSCALNRQSPFCCLYFGHPCNRGTVLGGPCSFLQFQADRGHRSKSR